MRGRIAKLYDAVNSFTTGMKTVITTGIPFGARSGESAFAKMLPGPLNYGGPGAWQYERAEQVKHNKHWVFTSIEYLAAKMTERRPLLGYVRDADDRQKYAEARKKAVRSGAELPPLRHFMSAATRKASGHFLRPNEEIEYADSKHELNLLLDNPNGPDTWISFWREAVMYKWLCGVNYTWKVPSDSGGVPVAELWNIPAHWVIPVSEGHERLVDYYEVKPWGASNGALVRFAPEEIIEVKNPHPLNKLGAQSPIGAIPETIDQYDSLQLARYWWWKNGAQLGTIFEIDGGESAPSDKDIERFESQLYAKYQGETKAGRPTIMPPGVRANRDDASREMSFLASADHLRDYIIAQPFRLSRTILGNPDGVPWATFVGEYRRVIQDVLYPESQLWGGVFTERLCADYDEDLHLFWELPSPQSDEQLLAAFQGSPGAGASVNEYRTHILHLEPLDDPQYDEPMTPAGMVPGGQDDGGFDSLFAGVNGPMENPGGTGGSVEDDFADTPAGVQDPAQPSLSSGRSPLLDTVGGANALASLQQRFASGEITRDMAINNAKLIFGLSDDEASRMFPPEDEGNSVAANEERQGKRLTSWLGKRGPAPFPGAVFNEQTHRWERPTAANAGGNQGGGQSQTGGGRDTGSGESALAQQARSLASKIKEGGEKAVAAAKAIGARMAEVANVVNDAAAKLGISAEDIADTAWDYSKITYCRDNAITEHLGIGASSAATIASHIAAYGIVKLKQALAKRRGAKSVGGDESLASAIAAVVGAMYEATGAGKSPSEEDAAEWLAKRGKAAHGASAFRRKVRDEQGHEHDSGTGQFTSSGGSGGKPESGGGSGGKPSSQERSISEAREQAESYFESVESDVKGHPIASAAVSAMKPHIMDAVAAKTQRELGNQIKKSGKAAEKAIVDQGRATANRVAEEMMNDSELMGSLKMNAPQMKKVANALRKDLVQSCRESVGAESQEASNIAETFRTRKEALESVKSQVIDLAIMTSRESILDNLNMDSISVSEALADANYPPGNRFIDKFYNDESYTTDQLHEDLSNTGFEYPKKQDGESDEDYIATCMDTMSEHGDRAAKVLFDTWLSKTGLKAGGNE